MDNVNAAAVQALGALQTGFRSTAQGENSKADSLQVAIDVLNGLYAADLTWRDTQVEAYRELIDASHAAAVEVARTEGAASRDQEVADLKAKLVDAEAVASDLQKQLDTPTSDVTAQPAEAQAA